MAEIKIGKDGLWFDKKGAVVGGAEGHTLIYKAGVGMVIYEKDGEYSQWGEADLKGRNTERLQIRLVKIKP